LRAKKIEEAPEEKRGREFTLFCLFVLGGLDDKHPSGEGHLITQFANSKANLFQKYP
jgi:hypothetical protein